MTIFDKLLLGLGFLAAVIYIVTQGKDYIIIYFNNFGVPRAEKCHRINCGFYPKGDDHCAHNRVTDKMFKKYNSSGNHKGCKYSFARNMDIGRKASTQKYLDAYMNYKKEYDSQDKQRAYSFISFVLLTMTLIVNTFMVFFSK